MNTIYIKNFISTIVWIVADVILYNFIYFLVRMDFQGINVKGAEEYMQNILVVSVLTGIIFLALFFCLTLSRNSLRESLECKSFAWIMSLGIVLLIVAFYFFFKCPGIKDNNGNIHVLTKIFCFPAIYFWLMFFLPPVNIMYVVLPGSLRVRLGVAAIFMIIMVVFLLI